MSDRKAKTIKLKQGQTESDYARVPERLKEFREDCPRGDIQTKYQFLENGQVAFEAYVLKDKKDPSSGSATGHSLGHSKGQKDFEKLETIAVGRALALLGYLASGEIASSEEMEAFNEYKEDQHNTAVTMAKEAIEDSKTIDELKEVFVGLGALIAEEEIVAAKDKRKAELTKVKEVVNASA